MLKISIDRMSGKKPDPGFVKKCSILCAAPLRQLSTMIKNDPLPVGTTVVRLIETKRGKPGQRTLIRATFHVAKINPKA